MPFIQLWGSLPEAGLTPKPDPSASRGFLGFQIRQPVRLHLSRWSPRLQVQPS